jgi:hypothetical protein
MEHLSGREQWDSKLFRVVNSAICSALAYLSVLFTCGATKSFTESLFQIKSNLMFYESFPVANEPDVWYLKNILIIFSSGILASVILGLLGLFLFHRLKEFNIPIVMYFLWLYVWAIAMFCAQGLLALLGLEEYYSPYFNNFVVALAWLRFPKILAYVLVPLSLAALTFLCFFSTRPFISVSYSYGKVNKLQKRRKFFFETAMVPFAISAMFVTALIFPEPFTYTNLIYVGYAALAMIISWYLLFYVDVDREGIFRNEALQKFNLFIVIMFALAIGAIYWKLQYGIKIG